MFDMSWGEVMVIGAVALIVIGPKDLPKALRTLGNMTAKVRRMAAEFQGQFSEAMREAELDEVKRQIQGVNDSVGSLNQGFNPMQTIRDELKGSIEAPATAHEKTPGATVAEASAQGRGEAGPAAPMEPPIALPIPSVPPIVDPAESIAAAVRQAAAAEEPTPAAGPAPAPERSSEKA
ncbi:MAG TPA: Sec-independent protein translocase protein TatB [Microvirga sp.]|jgi:sec-independent protein translocase protein TatB